MDHSNPDQEISQFLLRACHDVRAAARGVRTHSELLLRDAGANKLSDVEQRLGFVVEGARKIDVLLDGLAAYSIALQTERRGFQQVRMDVLLRSVMARLKKNFDECGAEVEYGPLPSVSGNADRLMQLWEQLLRNAVAHRGTAAPRISVSADELGEAWQFTVLDNGPGVEEESLDAIFKPFEHLQPGGAGLGLAICREIVQRHGGRIWAEARPGGGGMFRFTLPANQAAVNGA